MRSHQDYVDARASRRAAMLVAAREATDQSDAIIEGARAMLEALRTQGDVETGGLLCELALRSALLGQGRYANVAVMDARGDLGCSARQPAESVNMADESWFAELRAGSDFVVSGPIYGRVSRRHVVVAAVPILSSNGRFSGAIAASIVTAELSRAQDVTPLPDDAGLALTDAAGVLISANDRFPLDAIPAPLLAAEPANGHSLATIDAGDGQRIDIAVAPLVGDDVFVIVTRPHQGRFSPIGAAAASSFLLSLMMWLLALAAIWFSTDRLVLRWLSYLGRIARVYGAGHFDVAPDRAASAPAEIAELADAMAEMAEKINERETDLQDSLDQKQLLLKEIHHRVKNNLQIIVSLLNIQISRSKSAAAKDSLNEARGRINALALVHKSLYEAEDLRSVRLAPFFDDLVKQLSSAVGASERNVNLIVRSDDIGLSPDQAVPLALFVTEAVMNALKHAFNGAAGGRVEIQISRIADMIDATVSDNGVGMDGATPEDVGVGSSLMSAFARQLGGSADFETTQGGGLTVRLTVPMKRNGANAGEEAADGGAIEND